MPSSCRIFHLLTAAILHQSTKGAVAEAVITITVTATAVAVAVFYSSCFESCNSTESATLLPTLKLQTLSGTQYRQELRLTFQYPIPYKNHDGFKLQFFIIFCSGCSMTSKLFNLDSVSPFQFRPDYLAPSFKYLLLTSGIS